MPALAINKRAKADYTILETFDAGIKLTGAEVKSTKLGGMRLVGSFVTVHNNQVFLTNAHISRYKPAGPQPDYDPERSRALLVTRNELNRIGGRLRQKGFTLIPLRAYTAHNLIKIEFGVGRGRKEYEKRDVIKKRESDRAIKRAMNRS